MSELPTPLSAASDAGQLPPGILPRLMEMALNIHPEGVVILDSRGNVVFLNAQATHLLGNPPKDRLKWPICEICGEAAGAIQEYLRGGTGGTGGEIRRQEVVLRRGDGSEFPALLQLATLELPDGPVTVAFFRDMTAEQRAAQTLAESERFARNIVDALDAHIAIIDEQGVIVAVNQAWRDFANAHGLGSRGNVGVNYLATCDTATGPFANEAPAVAAGIRDVLAGRRAVFTLEYPCHDAATQRWFCVRVTRFRGPGPVRVVIAHENITERRLAEAAAQEHQTQLAHLSRVTTVGQLASGLAHELNQPLGAILNYSVTSLYLLRDGQMVSPAVREALGEVIAETTRAAEIVKRLRAFVRKQEARRVPTDLNGLVEESLRLLSAETRRGGVRIVREFAPRLPPVLVDPIQIEQVLVNFIQNALDALRTLPSGCPAVLTIATYCDGSAAGVAVTDNGPGIPVDIRARIFDAFFTTKPEGLGMGLTLARSIIDSHGGHLQAMPGPNAVGARFQFSLPLADASAPRQ